MQILRVARRSFRTPRSPGAPAAASSDPLESGIDPDRGAGAKGWRRGGRIPVWGLGLAAMLFACNSPEVDPLEEIRQLQADGQVEESVERLQALVESGDQRGEVLYRYGRGLSALGRVGRAVWPLDAAIEDPVWRLRAAQELALNAYHTQNFELALQTLARLREERTDGQGDEDLPSMLLEARSYIGTRRHYPEALDVLEVILDQEPDHDEARRLKAAALLGLKRTDEAYELIRASAGTTDEPEAAEGAEASDGGLDLAEAGADETDESEAVHQQDEAYWCSIESTFKRESGEIDEAERIVEACLERFPTSVALMNEAVEVYSTQGKAEKVLALLRAAYEKEPENRVIRFPLVLQLRGMGRMTEAVSILQREIDRLLEQDAEDSDSPESKTALASAWVDLAGLLVDQEDIAAGLDAYAKANALLGDSVAPELLFSQAEAMLRIGRYADALEIAEKTPVEVHGPMIRGRVAFEQGDFERALAELDRAALLWPNNAPVRYYLARAAEGLGRFDRAIEEYRQAIRSDQALEAARVRLAQLHLAEGRVVQARAILYFAVGPRDPHASLDSKLVDLEIQVRARGQADLGALPTDPKRSVEEIRQLVARAISRGLRERSGPLAAAQGLATLQAQANGPFASALLRERIENLLRADEIESAQELAQSALRAHPKDALAQLAVARSLTHDASKLAESQALLSQVVARRPEDAQARAWLGDVELRRGQIQTALEHFEAALAISADQHEAIVGLARALVAGDRRETAIARLEAYLAHDAPFDGEAALELARLLEATDATQDYRIRLGERALRFGAGQAAADLLAEIDPERAPANTAEF